LTDYTIYPIQNFEKRRLLLYHTSCCYFSNDAVAGVWGGFYIS